MTYLKATNIKKLIRTDFFTDLDKKFYILRVDLHYVFVKLGEITCMYCSQSNVVLLSNDEYTLHGFKFFFIKELKIFCKVKKSYLQPTSVIRRDRNVL